MNDINEYEAIFSKKNQTHFEILSQIKVSWIFSEYSQYFQLNLQTLQEAQLSTSKLKILHPGPVNWGIEMHPELKNHKMLLIDDQVKNGLFCRMAVLDFLLS